MLRFTCPHCAAANSVDRRLLHSGPTTLRCQGCGHSLQIAKSASKLQNAPSPPSPSTPPQPLPPQNPPQPQPPQIQPSFPQPPQPQPPQIQIPPQNPPQPQPPQIHPSFPQPPQPQPPQIQPPFPNQPQPTQIHPPFPNIPAPPLPPSRVSFIVSPRAARKKGNLALLFGLIFLAFLGLGASGAAFWFAFGSLFDPESRAVARLYDAVLNAEQAYEVNLDFKQLLIPDDENARPFAEYVRQFNQTAADASALANAFGLIDLNAPQYAAVPRDVKTSFENYRAATQELAKTLNANVVTEEQLKAASNNVDAASALGGLLGLIGDVAASSDEYVYDEYDDRYYRVSRDSNAWSELGADFGRSVGLEKIRSQFNAIVVQKARPLAQTCVDKRDEFYQLRQTL
ncbi:MAG: hypothetical protein IJ991_08920 [Thermoguttaceae bacterium]|nr:hypothetical protein [Thermoguttaceae bacterium]